jgi:peptidoglycan hydrolase-like protein with peptidoglycan-binding domain
MAFQRELRQYWGYSGNIDGIVGPLTVEALQRLLVQWGYPSNEIDGIPGPKTEAAFARFANYLISTGY